MLKKKVKRGGCDAEEDATWLAGPYWPVVWSRVSSGSRHVLGSGSQTETWPTEATQWQSTCCTTIHCQLKKWSHKRVHRQTDRHTRRCRDRDWQRQTDVPVHGVAELSIHDHGFEHGAFTHHKLDHSVDEREQIPRRKTQLKQTDSEQVTLLLPKAKPVCLLPWPSTASGPKYTKCNNTWRCKTHGTMHVLDLNYFLHCVW